MSGERRGVHSTRKWIHLSRRPLFTVRRALMFVVETLDIPESDIRSYRFTTDRDSVIFRCWNWRTAEVAMRDVMRHRTPGR